MAIGRECGGRFAVGSGQWAVGSSQFAVLQFAVYDRTSLPTAELPTAYCILKTSHLKLAISIGALANSFIISGVLLYKR